jgi:RraA family protein
MGFEELRKRLRALDTACVCDADRTLRVLDPGMRPLRYDLILVGRAHTVSCRDDFLTVIKALEDTRPGDVLVIDGNGGRRAVVGELVATECVGRGLAGIVVDGAVRDTGTLRRSDLPVYCRYITPVAGTAVTISETQIPVQCGGVEVRPGDLVFGDGDGILVAAADELTEVIASAEAIDAAECRVLKQMAEGKALVDMLNLAQHVEALLQGKQSRLTFTV